ncbi:MAG: ABC transporter permease subunit [Clostridia bacterium]|nr:ABC transporter permease subunit [Clostridia bacterium]
MKNFKNILKYEAVRTWAQKKWILLIVAVLAAFFIVFSVSYATSDKHKLTTFDRAKILQEYREDLDAYSDVLEKYGDTLTKENEFELKRSIERFRFFLDTETIEYDYITNTDYITKYKGYEAFGYCTSVYESMTYVFCAFALVGALWTFSAERHTVKNLLAAPIKRKEIFAVKTCVTFTEVTALPVLLFIVLLIVCACSPQRPYLMYSGGFKAVTGTHIFAQIGIRNILLVALFYAVTLLCTMYFKPLPSGLIPTLGIVALIFLSMIITGESKFIMLGKAAFETYNLYPVLGLWNYLGGFDIHFIIMAFAYFAIICSLVFWSLVKFKRKDF